MNSCKFGKNTPFKPVSNSSYTESFLFLRSLISDTNLTINMCRKDFTLCGKEFRAPYQLKKIEDKKSNDENVRKFIESMIGVEGRINKEIMYENASTNKEKFTILNFCEQCNIPFILQKLMFILIDSIVLY